MATLNAWFWTDCNLSQLDWLILGAQTGLVYLRVLLQMDLYVSRSVSLS